MAVNIPIITAIASVAVGGYSAYESNQQANFAKDQANQARAQADTLQGQETANTNQAAMLMLKRRAAAGSGMALQDTILTGPSGTGGTSNQPGQKTLLGM